MAAQLRVPRSPLDLTGTAARALFQAGDSTVETTAAGVGSSFGPMLLLVALCQLADLITFNFAVEMYGPAGELGPLGLVYRFGGFWAVAVVKLGLIGIVMAVLARYPWQRLVTRRRLALIVAAVGIVGAWTNTLAFVRF
jgi:hypothetical protein